MNVSTSLRRSALSLAVVATVGVGGALPAIAAPETPSASGDGQVSAASTHYRTVLKLKVGKRSVRTSACIAPSPSGGGYAVKYKSVARKTSDRVYPRVKITIGTGTFEEYALFPGGRTKKSSSSPHAPSEVFKVKLTLKGKNKTKRVAVGNLRSC